MNDKTLNTLNYNDIKEKIKEYCLSDLGKKLVDEIRPSTDIKLIRHLLNETTEARNLIDNSYAIPLKGVTDISTILFKIDKEMMLDISDLNKVTEFLRGCSTVKMFFVNKEFYAKNLTSYSLNITDMPEIISEISTCIKGNAVDTNATKELKKIRRQIEVCEGKIKEKLEKFINNSANKNYIQDPIVVQRNNKYVVPIKSSYKNSVDGTVIEQSAKGNTCFVEPSSVSKYTAELDILRIEEEVEIYKILAQLSELVYARTFEFKMNVDIITKYDMIFAKGKFSFNNKGIAPKINNAGRIDIKSGVHPLIENFEPLNFNIAKDYRALVITGPNAGGKTVVLKTVGILTLMTVSGIHIRAKEGTEISIFQNIFVDIGDNQSIENSLSTFSSHMKNLSDIIGKTNKSTLVLLDEIGSGTEPNEGAGLGIAILEELYKKGAIILATTHYSEIKSFSEQHPNFENAKMEYKKDTLEPLYKLKIGLSGDSNAFYIAKKMGIPENVREKALRYIETKDYDLTIIDKSKINKYIEQTDEEDRKEEFSIGDRVMLLDDKRVGIVYNPMDSKNNVSVFIDNEIISVFSKRLEILGKAEDLYPVDYDLNTLFVSFEERKFNHDMERGSKKALKKIQREIRKR